MWRGTALAIHLIRFLSVLMGAGTVYLGYRLLLEIWPERWGLALAAAALTAFNPMFLFISGAVNNDNLAMLLCALGIWLLVRLVKRHGARDSCLGERVVARCGAAGHRLGTGRVDQDQRDGLAALDGAGGEFCGLEAEIVAAFSEWRRWSRRGWWR